MSAKLVYSFYEILQSRDGANSNYGVGEGKRIKWEGSFVFWRFFLVGFFWKRILIWGEMGEI